ncbi:hypothetical protein ACX80D_05930 [Arthrobacter sp. Sr24]
MRDLQRGINISRYVSTDGIGFGIAAAARVEGREARNRVIAEAAAIAGETFADMEAALLAMGAAARQVEVPKYVMPPPLYPTGNIAKQKRRRKL